MTPSQWAISNNVTTVRCYDMKNRKSVYRAAKGGVYVTWYCDTEEAAIREAMEQEKVKE
jgi:hypothetical protein